MKLSGCNLLGWDWFRPLGIEVSGVYQFALDGGLMGVFDGDLNQYKGPTKPATKF